MNIRKFFWKKEMHLGQLRAKPFFCVVWGLVFIIVNHCFIRTDSNVWKCLHTFRCVGPQGIFSLGIFYPLCFFFTRFHLPVILLFRICVSGFASNSEMQTVDSYISFYNALYSEAGFRLWPRSAVAQIPLTSENMYLHCCVLQQSGLAGPQCSPAA